MIYLTVDSAHQLITHNRYDNFSLDFYSVIPTEKTLRLLLDLNIDEGVFLGFIYFRK